MSKKIPIPPKSELESIYAKEGMTISSLANLYDTSNPTVRKWLIDYSIKRKSHKQASTEANSRHKKRIKPDKKQLEQLYSESTIESLSAYFSVSQATIYEWIEECSIEVRSLSESTKLGKQKQHQDIHFTKEFLDKEYDRTKSIITLAEKLNVSKTHIRNQLLSNDIKIEPINPPWRSKAEIDLYDYLKGKFPNDTWIGCDRSIIAPFELDIVNLDKKIAIEYCGLYWHSETSSGKKKNYHKQKYLKCKEKGYRLITVFESDDMEKVKYLVSKLVGSTKKIGARKTQIAKIDSRLAMQFHKEHHLHSSVGASHHYGLFNGGDLLMVASFGKNRFSKKYEYECSRITSHSEYTVVGGVSKLINHFIKEVRPKSIVTFSDLRFGDGNVYLKCGFNYVGMTEPNYWYWKKNTTTLFSRVKFQKHKLCDILENYDPLKTEYENMMDDNWDRIWDCGNAKFIWEQ